MLMLRQIYRSDIVSFGLIVDELDGLEPGPLKVVAIETGAGLFYLNPEDGGITIRTILPIQDGNDIMVEDNESVHIYQSTKQFQITGSGFKDNTKASGTSP